MFLISYDVYNVPILFRDFSVMNKTVQLAKSNGVRVGAHPSLPDLQGFGRREMAMEPVPKYSLPFDSGGRLKIS